MANKTLKCRDCSTEFIFTESEQDFYKAKGFENEPQRCLSCRQARKQHKTSGSSFGGNNWGNNRNNGRSFGGRW